MPPSEFSTISGDWDKLGIPNLAQMTNVSNKKLLNAAKYQGENQQDRVEGLLYYLTRATRVSTDDIKMMEFD